MMKCKNCKNEIPDGSIFCMFCGTPIIKQKSVKKSKDDISVPEPKQLSDGTWFIQLRKENQYIKGNSASECKSRAIAVRSGLVQHQALIKDTLGVIIDDYIASCESSPSNGSKKKSKSVTTVKAYKSYRNHRFQSIMNKKVQEIDWQDAIDEECGLVSGKTVLNAWRLITASMKHYNRNHSSSAILIPDVILPEADSSEHLFLDYEQIITLINACRDTPYELPILLGLHGLRRSEIMALTSDDIDAEARKIHVNKAMRIDSDNNHIISFGNKTKLSTRFVDIHLDRILELTKDKSGLLFDGSINDIYRHVNTLCRHNNLPEIGVHGLRHSFASLCYHLKLDIRYVMLQGGWASPDVPQKIYIHLSEQDNLKDSKKLRKFFQKAENSTIYLDKVL